MGWASAFLNNFPNWASNISYSYVFMGPETFLISAFFSFLSVKYTLSPLRILIFAPKSCFYPQKASYFLWILRYEAVLFLKFFLNFLTLLSLTPDFLTRWFLIKKSVAEIFLIWSNVARAKNAWTNVTVTVCWLNQIGLVSVCAKSYLPSMSRRSWKVWGGVVHCGNMVMVV